MKPMIQLKDTLLFVTAFLLATFGFMSIAHAVVPAPDGGYPGQNTAEGQSALLHLAGGTYNTALGWASLRFNATGNLNTGVGAATLLKNTADNNTATGAGALLTNTTGASNTANGTFALFNNTTGNSNTAIGLQALFGNTTGGFNTAIGLHALISNTTASDNSAVGAAALFNNTTGGDNTAIGDLALSANTIGGTNTAIGAQALLNNTTGSLNTAIGYQALMSNIGADNTAAGVGALGSNTTGVANTAFGLDSLGNNTTGTNNTAFGVGAGQNVTTANDVICIRADGANVDNSCFIGNIRGMTTAINDAIPVLIDSLGQLGTLSSSRRFKNQIKPMDKASEVVLALRPVTFHYKSDKANRPEFGLIAEEVAEVNSDLVVRDKDGEIYTVRYDAVNAMLLNEFLKEHRKVEQMQKQIDALTAGLQKVSTQLATASPSLADSN